MQPVDFLESNTKFTAPDGMTEGQVMTIPAFKGQALNGSCDGIQMVVVAWKPDPGEIDRLIEGHLVYLTVMGGLPSHFITTQEATNPA